MKKLTHVDQQGKARMVDVSAKPVQRREAVARGAIMLQRKTLALIFANQMDKGDVLSTARLAGIQAAKRTSDLIPLCHPLPLEDCQIRIDAGTPAPNGEVEVAIHCRTRTTAKTGVEMEALTGAAVAALTLYDMGKAATHGIVIREIRLLEKTGGKSRYVAS